MSVTETYWPAVTSSVPSLSVPAAGSVVIFTAANASAGESLASLNPKSAAAKVWSWSSSVVTVLSAPDGASLTDATVIGTLVSSELSLPSQNGPAVPQSSGSPRSVTVNLNPSSPWKLALGS